MGRRDSMIKAKDGAELKAQIICRKVLEDKVEGRLSQIVRV